MLDAEIEITETLDVSGLSCPLPLLKARKALAGLSSGSVLQVRATDPGSWRDFMAYVEHSNHDMLYSAEEESVFVYVIRKGA